MQVDVRIHAVTVNTPHAFYGIDSARATLLLTNPLHARDWTLTVLNNCLPDEYLGALRAYLNDHR